MTLTSPLSETSESSPLMPVTRMLPESELRR